MAQEASEINLGIGVQRISSSLVDYHLRIVKKMESLDFFANPR
jgi:hypothetical protein